MNACLDPFPLRGRCLGISISAGDEGIPRGEDADAFVNRLSFETCSRYLFLGASIALGHNWREEGIMDHLALRASEYRYSFGSPEREGRRAPIINRLAWPDKPPEFDEDRALWIRDFVEARQVPPPGIPTGQLSPGSELGQFARIRALTAMRRELVTASDFRICLGGAAGVPLRRLPGVLEEALLTWEAGKPLYLSGVFGGMTKALCDVILRRRLASGTLKAFETPPEATALFAKFKEAYPCPEAEGPSLPGGQFCALAQVECITPERLADQAGLSLDDYITLMTTPEVGRALQLVSLGIVNRSQGAKLPPSGA